MDSRDRGLLEDIMAYGEECDGFLRGVALSRFEKDRRLQLATERLLEIIGEAAGALSDEARSRLDYDWRAVRGLRNLIAHQYGVIDAEAIYNVVRNRLPELLGLVRKTLAANP